MFSKTKGTALCKLVWCKLVWRTVILALFISIVVYIGFSRIPKLSPTSLVLQEVCREIRNSTNCFSTSNCDCECTKLKRRLSEWPAGKPKAFIYYLTKVDRLEKMIDSLKGLDKYFNDKFNYPVIIFHENETCFRHKLLSATRSELYFQSVNFEVPDFLPRDLTQRSCHWSMGYRHMCRFHAKQLYEHPIIRGFEFAWRLDDDSKILENIEYDVFQYMQNHDLKYGYVLESNDRSDCVMNLWERAENFIKSSSINTTFFNEWKRPRIYYNNFEISRLSLWLSPKYQRYINFIDSLGGIYYHRWGDAPIKTIAVSMFVAKNQTHRFQDIKYSHQDKRN